MIRRFPVTRHSARISRCALLLIVLLFTIAQAQTTQRKDEKSQEPDDVVRVKSNLVSVDVIVKDKNRKYVTDLKAEDFTIREDGVPQKLEFFESPLGGSSGKTIQSDLIKSSSGDGPRNLISLVLDGQITDITNVKRVREGTIEFVKEKVSDTDLVALFSVTGGLQLIQPFTQDKTQIISALEKFGISAASKNFEQKDIAGNISTLRDQPSGPPLSSITTPAGGSAAAQAMVAARVLQQFIKLRTALSLQQARPILAALAAICEGLRPLPGKKTLVLFSQGFVTPAVLDWQVQSTIDIANRANVAIYIIDAAGLRADAPRSGSLVPASPLAGVSAIANQEQRIRAVGGETIFDTARQEGESREYDILYRMSEDTGGRLIKGNNDITQGLERINEEIRARYTLAYRSTNQNFDGTFRKVKIEARRAGAEVISRAGYFAVPHEELVPLSPAEKKLLADVTALQANPGLPMSVEFASFRAGDGLYTVPVSLELPPSAIKFNRKGDRQDMQLDILGVIRTGSDRILSRMGGSFDVSLTAEQYQSILMNNIFYRQDVQLGPGDYVIDLVVRDRQSGKTAATSDRLVLAEPDSEFATTTPVLSRFVEPAKPQTAAETRDVLSHANIRIRPSPGRRFKPSDNLILFLDVYNAANSVETGKPLVRVTVRLMQDGKPVTKPFDYVLTDTEGEPVPHLTFAEYIRLSGLAPGKYTAAIEAKDMVTKKFVKRETGFVVE